MTNVALLTRLLANASNGEALTVASYAFALTFGLTTGFLTAFSLFDVFPWSTP